MKKLNVAILEDNKDLLKQLVLDIKDNELANVVISETEAISFLEKVKLHENIDLLILDIELSGQSIDGIEVASIVKKPVLFASGKSVHFLSQIEDINLDSDFPVDSIMKPLTVDKLKKALKKIGDEITWFEKQMYVNLKIEGQIIRFNQMSIVYIETVTDGSNNKKIHFTDQKPKILFNFSFGKMVEKGFNEEMYIKTHNSFRVNRNHIKNSNLTTRKLTVEKMNENLKLENIEIPISESYYSSVRKMLLKK